MELSVQCNQGVSRLFSKCLHGGGVVSERVIVVRSQHSAVSLGRPVYEVRHVHVFIHPYLVLR